ncbi:MAG: response regulator transcription factor [Ruminococcaceae bacterium]|nr:response regulator transcription factor [Oscillospiraceae bacterium]
MDSKKKILVVEDEKNIAQVLAYNIKKEGYDCDIAYDGESGLNMALENRYDLILLDIMLPKMTGFEVCERIRYKSQVPIIFVTAREEEKDKILGLETGADDYVTKPFSFKELISRIRANIRRSSGEIVTEKKEDTSETIVVGELVIDTGRYSVTKNGEEVELSKKDYDLILFLAQNLGMSYSREDLLEKIWGYDDYYGDIRTVDVTVSRIRKKIENDPARPEYLMTKRGVGYYLCKR